MTEILVKNLQKSFRQTTVLKDVNLHFQGGNIYGIVGYNGSGKTVLFRCICGLLKYEQGTIEVNNRILHKDMDMLTNVGIIIEEPGYLKNQNAYQNLDFLYRIRNKKDPEHIYAVLEKVGLNPRDPKKVGKYSLGMKQRLAIAQAIMEDPEILILDEPMNGLDKNGVMEMRKIFAQMKDEGKLLLLASHNKEDIDVLCDEIYEIDNGTITRLR